MLLFGPSLIQSLSSYCYFKFMCCSVAMLQCQNLRFCQWANSTDPTILQPVKICRAVDNANERTRLIVPYNTVPSLPVKIRRIEPLTKRKNVQISDWIGSGSVRFICVERPFRLCRIPISIRTGTYSWARSKSPICDVRGMFRFLVGRIRRDLPPLFTSVLVGHSCGVKPSLLKAST
jgi:hypothetical protein